MARSFSESIKLILTRVRLPSLYQALRKRQLYRQWIADGRPVPPPHVVKQDTVIEFGHRFRIPVFIESGTYLGQMVHAVKEVFPEIYSIELGTQLFERVQKEFAQAQHITILHGDSGEILGQILDRIQKPCLFWLDGHFSEGITVRGAVDTPIRSELRQILRHPLARRHVILIDDARLFTGESHYPTIGYLRELVAPVGFSNFEVVDDIVRIFNK
jgi:hypothetical protein